MYSVHFLDFLGFFAMMVKVKITMTGVDTKYLVHVCTYIRQELPTFLKRF